MRTRIVLQIWPALFNCTLVGFTSGAGAPFGMSWAQLQSITKVSGGGGSSNTGIIIAVVGGLVALLIVGTFLIRRRSGSEPVELEQE